MPGSASSTLVALVALGVVSAIGLVGCGSSRVVDDGRVHIEAANYPMQWLAEQVGGAAVDVGALTPPGAEPHDLELTPKEVARVVDADLVVLIGGFQPTVDDAAAETKGAVFDAADAVHLTGADGAIDPHFWLDPIRYGEAARALGERLAHLDAPHADAYRRRAANVVARLGALDHRFERGLRSCRSRDLVTTHAAFGYLSRRYRLHQVAVTGISPESEPSPKRLAEVADLVRRRDVATIYFERLVPGDLARTVADETGAAVAVLDPVEGITDESAGTDYLSVMDANLATLEQGQGCS